MKREDPETVDSGVPMRALLAGARRKEPALVELARKLVQCESPSDSKAAVDACVALAADEIRARGGKVKLRRQHEYGDVLEVRFGPKNKRPKPVLLGAS